MITSIILVTLIGLLAIASAFTAAKRLRDRSEKPFASASVAAIPAGQLAAGSSDYSRMSIDQLLAAAEERIRTDPVQIELRRQQQIKQENERKARQAASAARKLAATEQQTTQPQAAVAQLPAQKPAKRASKPKPTWEDIEALRKKRESLPPLPAPAGCVSTLLTTIVPSPKLESAIPVQQQASSPQTLNSGHLSLFQRSFTILKFTAQRCQSLVQKTTRLAQSIPRIFSFLASRFWQKHPPGPPSAENTR